MNKPKFKPGDKVRLNPKIDWYKAFELFIRQEILLIKDVISEKMGKDLNAHFLRKRMEFEPLLKASQSPRYSYRVKIGNSQKTVVLFEDELISAYNGFEKLIYKI